MVVVSVIIPVYNTEEYLRECVESVLSQTFRDFEVICVDDGSTDDSLSILREFEQKDNRVKVISKNNGGVVSARKAGIEKSSGEFLSFVDSDDMIAPNMLERLVNEIGEADLVSCGIRREGVSGNWCDCHDSYDEGLYSKEGYRKLLATMIHDTKVAQRYIPGVLNKLYRKEVVMQVIPNMEEGIRIAEDALFTYKYLLKSKSVKILHESLYYYRNRTGSAMHSINKTMLIDINRIYLALEEAFKEHSMADILLSQLQRWIAMLTCNALNVHMGFDKECVYIPEFQIDTDDLRGKRIALYGAGKCGQDIHRQLNYFEYPIGLWADRDYFVYEKQGMAVVSPEILIERQSEQDVILIAVGNEVFAENIRKELISKGMDESKIIWKKPRHIY